MTAEGTGHAGSVLVTGAGGFLGANLVWVLRANGFSVRALTRRPPSGPQWAGLDGVQFLLGDLREGSHIDWAVEGVTAIIHAAAVTRLIPRPRRESYRVNVEGTRRLCAAALKHGVRRFVFTSSIATIAPGTAEHPSDDESPNNREQIRAPYYASKRLAERVIQEYQALGLETITFCPGYILGPRDARPTSNELLLYAARTHWPFFPPGGINVIDVREAALAHVRALWLGQPGQRYLLAGPYRRYAELGAIVRRLLGESGSVHRIPRWTNGIGSLILAIASALYPNIPNGLSVPSFQYGFVPYHVSGARADATFHLHHRPVEESVRDTLCWFRDSGLAPWLPRRFNDPPSS